MRSARSATPSSSSYFFIAPIQQRLIEFENRFRKWRIFNRRSSSASRARTAGVEIVSVDAKKHRQRPICFTSPIPRKTYYDNNNMNEPRARPGFVGRPRQVSDEEVETRYQLVEQNSGELSIGGVLYSGVRSNQIVHVATLGSGTCGTVYKVKLQSRVMAEKVMKRTDNKEQAKRIFMDLDVIRRSNDCRFIVQCYGYIITEDHLNIYMEIMLCCTEKLLHERGDVGLPEDIISKITWSVTQALIFLQDTLSLMHRDIKPSNILLNWLGNIKLCDFGISGQLIDSNAASMTAGCIGYLAPERTRQEPYKANADVWSLGITLVHLALGEYPYKNTFSNVSSPFELMLKIRDTEPPKLNPSDGFSVEFCTFVQQCLKASPEERPKFKELLDLPFLQNVVECPEEVQRWLKHQNDYSPKPARISEIFNGSDELMEEL